MVWVWEPDCRAAAAPVSLAAEHPAEPMLLLRLAGLYVCQVHCATEAMPAVGTWFCICLLLLCFCVAGAPQAGVGQVVHFHYGQGAPSARLVY